MTQICAVPRDRHQTQSNVISTVGGNSSDVTVRFDRLIAETIALEFLLIACACYLASIVYQAGALSHWPSTEQYVPAALHIAVLVSIVSLGFKHYFYIQEQSRDRFMWNGLTAVVLAFSLFLALQFVLKTTDSYSRGTFFFQFFAAIAAMVVYRGSVHAHVCCGIQSGTVEVRRAVVIGNDSCNVEMIETLRHSGVRTVGVLQFPCIHGNVVPGVGGVSWNIRKLVERCRSLNPDDVIFLATASELQIISCIADALSELPVSAHIVPVGASELWASARVSSLGRIVTMQVLRPPIAYRSSADCVAAFPWLCWRSRFLSTVLVPSELRPAAI
jgi:FlaA1/EpsC-like NDP-sugar epimerase